MFLFHPSNKAVNLFFQMLEAARELHKFFHDAKEVLAMIQEKENLLTDDLGRDLNSLHNVCKFQQLHT